MPTGRGNAECRGLFISQNLFSREMAVAPNIFTQLECGFLQTIDRPFPITNDRIGNPICYLKYTPTRSKGDV